MSNMESHGGTFQKIIYFEGGSALEGTRMRMPMPIWDAQPTKTQRNQIEEKLYELKNF